MIGASRSFLKEAAEGVEGRVVAGLVRATVLGLATVVALLLFLLLVALLLHRILGQTSDDGTTDCTKESMVDLVTTPGTCCTTGKGTGETTLTLLGTSGTILTISVFLVSYCSDRCSKKKEAHTEIGRTGPGCGRGRVVAADHTGPDHIAAAGGDHRSSHRKNRAGCHTGGCTIPGRTGADHSPVGGSRPAEGNHPAEDIHPAEGGSHLGRSNPGSDRRGRTLCSM